MDTKAIRISEFSVGEIRRVSKDLGECTDDTTIRHLVANYDEYKIKKGCKDMFSMATDDIKYSACKEREQFEIINQHQLALVEIAAKANYNIALGIPIKAEFAEFVKEFSILRNIAGWSTTNYFFTEPLSKEEFEKSQKKMAVEWEFGSEYPIGEYRPESERERKIRRSNARFFEIMESNIENITDDMKLEVFRLFPIAFETLRQEP